MLERLKALGRSPSPEGLDLLLIMCPPWDIQRPPINLAYLSAFMKDKGYRTDAWDLNIKFYNAVLDKPLRDLWDMMSQNTVTPVQMTDQFFVEAPELVDEFVDRILDARPRFLGFSTHYRNIVFTERMLERIRQKNKKIPVIYGGPEAIANYKIGALQNLNADAYVMGEGEISLLEMIQDYDEHGKFRAIPGVVVPVGKGKARAVSEFEPRKPIMELDTLPFPTYLEFDMNEYHPEENNVNLPFLFSRGCIGKCTFCMDHYIAGKHRTRSPENAIAEIKHHIESYGITHFGFNDLICNGSPKQLMRFCDLIVEENLNILWWSYAVIRRGLTPELFKKMRASGCVSVNFGMESGSTKVLKMMNKYYNEEIAEETVRNCARAGIQTSINIIVGFPGETRKEHQITLDFIKRNKDYIHSVVNVGTLMLAPGTKISTFPEDFGIKIDPERRTWYSDDGNNIEERNRRLEEVRQLLYQLNIPLTIINREYTEDGCADDGYAEPPVEIPQTEPCARIHDVKFYDALDQQCSAFHTGDQMILSIHYDVDKPVEDPMVRVQIYNDQNPNGDNVFVYGTNTERFNIRLGAVAAGRGEVRLIFYRLNQQPGTYRATIGLWPSEESFSPYDVAHGRYEFAIIGEPDDSGATAYLPHRWIKRDVYDASGDGRNALTGEMMLINADGIQKPGFMTQETMRARVEYEVADPDAVELIGFVRLKGGVAFRTTEPAPLLAGRHAIELSYEPLTLLEGAYEASFALVDAKTGEELGTVREPFDVRSRRIDGAGLVFNPVAWNIIKTPR